MIVPVILCGGSGSRLWPLSREGYPKQFLALTGEHTMLQNTVLRASQVNNAAPPVVISNQEHRFMVGEQLQQIGISPAAVILEPVGRNTAPAVTVAALQAIKYGDDPVLLVLPSDHLISNTEEFVSSVQAMQLLALEGSLITFGICPTGPETGYGYIKVGDDIGETGACRVDSFVEKPDAETAAVYLEEGRYYWNSGMFMFRASVWLEQMRLFAPDILESCEAAQSNASRDLDFLRLATGPFGDCRSDSIDYAVMEKTESAVMMPLDGGWNDVGSWAALWDTGVRDENGNVTRGDVMCADSNNNYLHAEGRLIAAVGLDDMVVVETADAVMVSPRSRTQEVKKIVERLRAESRPEAETHRKVYRPWGSYECIDAEDRFQAKRITVKPGASLSLQMHHHRAEHWIVVSGTAQVTRNDEVFLLTENHSTYIPLGATHRLDNPGKIPLELIEVQSGPYLGEDDIVRFDDVYGRQNEAKETE